jgi:predicted phosphodiesterase
MMRVLAIADEVEPRAYGGAFESLGPDLIVSCGDLPFDYLEYVVTTVGVPLAFVPGNHDPDLRRPPGISVADQLPGSLRSTTGPQGCLNIDGKVVDLGGLRIAGLGGSLRYKRGPNQYSQAEMQRRALRVELKCRYRNARDGRRVDLVVTHAPPLGVGDDDDLPHRGFQGLHRLVRRLSPKVLVHGHVHPHGRRTSEQMLGGTVVLNAVGHRIVEVAS